MDDPGGRPLAVPRLATASAVATGAASAPFWAGCDAGELRFQRCRACGRADLPPAEHCRECLSGDQAWEASAGLGTVYSWTVVHRPVTPDFAAPYAPVIVELDEGPLLVTNLVGCPPARLRVGLRVAVLFHRAGAGPALPYVHPVTHAIPDGSTREA
ncbi:OB-fold domain-containing protein [Frankia sp. AgB1.9]|uniref:Zn-ribbon domain-containing OB-fold protein n=1 Tax=unclassified Frankia TaxID=2632575 RepID=UPI001931F6FB|nr:MULTISPECIES: OB-fold domain-containing protein [unclassified Frankia]MBL7489411.1 OB-fold domain-containing protein [Frankia sp. AgW1.1]MBL7550654.1 OB-fold domain-containing protein [Frankia sp. AgB1.9]MBL7620971.1 OB-fold domain-containing protein [Frankia sp. AgB1.8]